LNYLERSSALIVIDTHPVQYRAPIYRALQQQFGIPVTVIYGSDFSLVGYLDKEFKTTFAWDTDLLSGYNSVFLSRVSQRGADCVEKVSARGIWRALEDRKPRALLIVGYALLFHQVAFYWSWRARCPILFRADTSDHAPKRGPVRAWLRDQILRWLYSRYEKLLYIGQLSHEHFRRLECPEEKLIFSPYCVDTTSFRCNEEARMHIRHAMRRELHIQEGEQVLLFSGKLIPRKGPDILLQTVKYLPSGIRQGTVLLFMGEGSLKRELEKEAKNLSPMKIRFLGFQNQKFLSDYYHAADLFVLPSRSEVWGVVVNEALHHGVPCVVSKAVGCAPDLIEPGVTGEIFETGSAQSLASALMRAFPLMGRVEIRKKCREKVAGYTVEKAAQGIAKAYLSAVGSLVQ